MNKILLFALALLIPTVLVANGFASYDAVHAKSSTHRPHRASSYHRPIRYFALMSPGSLRQNVVQIGHRYGWNTVVWNAPEDYLWVGRATVYSNSLPDLFSKILSKYPLQAQFYQGNRVLAIVPRNLP